MAAKKTGSKPAAKAAAVKTEAKKAVASAEKTAKETVKKTKAEVKAKAEAKAPQIEKAKAAVAKTVKKAESSVKKTAEKVTAKVTPKSTNKEPKETSIFKAIVSGDLASFKALVATQKNRRGLYGRTPLMVVSLIRSNPRMTDGSNYETKRVANGKAIYDEMYKLLLSAKCDTNAMDDAGNTARDYNYGGILNQMLAD